MKRSLCADGEMAHGPKRVKPELGITVKLEEYQEVALDKVMKNRVTYVCWPPGCGKTVLALCAAIQWGQGPVIVVAPLSLHDNFRRSMKQFQVPRNQQDRFLFYTAAGFKKQFVRDRQFTKGHMIIVDEAHQFRTDIRKGIMDTLARKKKEMSWMVVHQIRNHIHNRVIQHIPQEPEYECVVTQSLAMLEACRMADKILFMSGTPCVNKVSDLANFYAIAKGLDVPNHDDFNEIIWDQVSEMKKFFVFHEVKTGGGTSGGPSVGFPEVEKTDICLQVSHTQYQDVCEKKRNDEVLGTKAFLVGDRMCSNVMPYKIKFMESILAKHNHVKILIHSNFLKNGLQVVKASLDKLGRKSVAIVGNMTEKERSLNFLTFCDPHSGVDICLTSAAGSQGLDFKGVRVLIILESQWNMATKNQIIGRGARKFSHDHLPEDQRHLKVYQLLLEYPDGRSADEIMFGHAQRKDEHCDEFLTLLKS